ncbi:TPA: molecular chaperone [Klebsiella quasipneumoniae subsp. similipneumoniae]|nr:molecular chaperone [Klebsiella quasipneumoniae subsp. similipneumoniae]
MNTRASLINKFIFVLHFLFCANVYANTVSQGIAIEPMEIIFNDNPVAKFTVFNSTPQDYIVTQKVISEGDADISTDIPFIVNPPLRLIKEKAEVEMSVIYLKKNKEVSNKRKYYLSVSFIPKTSMSSNQRKIPLVLVQQIPVKLAT